MLGGSEYPGRLSQEMLQAQDWSVTAMLSAQFQKLLNQVSALQLLSLKLRLIPFMVSVVLQEALGLTPWHIAIEWCDFALII